MLKNKMIENWLKGRGDLLEGLFPYFFFHNPRKLKNKTFIQIGLKIKRDTTILHQIQRRKK